MSALDARQRPKAARASRRTARPSQTTAPPILVDVVRGETIESRHRGHIVHVDAAGRVIRAAGDPDTTIMLRSTVKPLALVALVESGAADGFGLTAQELAILCSSHTGEDKHVRTLQAIFRRASISQGMLRCGSEGAPIDSLTAARLARDGELPGPIRHSCSGFHAASLLLSAHAGWSLDGYTDPAHQSQVAIRDTLTRLLGRRPGTLRSTPDNCGLATYEATLAELALAYLLLAEPAGATVDGPRARSAPALRRIRDAMMVAPDMVGGTYDNLDTELMRRQPGRLVSKSGADGMRAIGFVAGAEPGAGQGPPIEAGAMAIKIEDGDLSRRAIKAASVEALAQIGILDDRDLRAMEAYHHPVVRTPDRKDAAVALPRFELAPLSELA